MKEYFAKLSSAERRFTVAVFLIIFGLLNAWLVWPQFGDWSKTRVRAEKSKKQLKLYEDKIAQEPDIKRKITQYESQGPAVPAEDMSTEFLRNIQSLQALTAVKVIASNRQPPRTNQFFVELAQALTIESGEEQLVDFLYRLGAGSSLIRIRGLSLAPDAPRQTLRVNTTLVASYQKKAPARPAAAPAAAKTTPATTPAAVPSPTPTTVKRPETPVQKPAPGTGTLPQLPGSPKPAPTSKQ